MSWCRSSRRCTPSHRTRSSSRSPTRASRNSSTCAPCTAPAPSSMADYAVQFRDAGARSSAPAAAARRRTSTRCARSTTAKAGRAGGRRARPGVSPSGTATRRARHGQDRPRRRGAAGAASGRRRSPRPMRSASASAAGGQRPRDRASAAGSRSSGTTTPPSEHRRRGTGRSRAPGSPPRAASRPAAGPSPANAAVPSTSAAAITRRIAAGPLATSRGHDGDAHEQDRPGPASTTSVASDLRGHHDRRATPGCRPAA